jgi:hypothetical protein
MTIGTMTTGMMTNDPAEHAGSAIAEPMLYSPSETERKCHDDKRNP